MCSQENQFQIIYELFVLELLLLLWHIVYLLFLWAVPYSDYFKPFRG